MWRTDSGVIRTRLAYCFGLFTRIAAEGRTNERIWMTNIFVIHTPTPSRSVDRGKRLSLNEGEPRPEIQSMTLVRD